MKEKAAAGPGAVARTARGLRETGVLRGLRALRSLNQTDGFDCPGCAWPDPARRGAIEFCENGAKAVAHEATRKRIGPDFFARWSLPELLGQSDQWLEAQGRLTQPLVKRPGADRYEPVPWDEALRRIARALQRLASPDQALFYTSGRTSNEAAFLYQLLARCFGTNNLPDCSNMCHESSGTGLGEAIGVGKGTVSLDDFDHADAIFVIGQNPGSNHPRMLTTLQRAARRGCRIVSINPLRERGLVSFANPQELAGLLGHGTPLAECFVRVRVGGDVALLKGIMKQVLALEAAQPGRVLDHAFIEEFTLGFGELRRSLEEFGFAELEAESGISRDEMGRIARIYVESERVIACWAMGLTQHHNGVANVQELTNLLLLRGNIGRPGAGPCPVRGHSNVQGDRTMGIWERPHPEFLRRLGEEFGFAPPASHGFDTVGAIEAMARGDVQVFVGMGGNFARATPDTGYTSEALRGMQLTAHVATTLNRSHLVTGDEAVLLPCLGRSERDVQAGVEQLVSVEDSMSAVHGSRGRLAPASPWLRSETAIICALASELFGAAHPIDWQGFAADYDRIRDRIARVIPGFEDFNRRVREPGGFVLQSGARSRAFETESGRAHFTVQSLPRRRLAPDQLLLTTLRSHDQYNTTVYSADDRYRGVHGDRRVVLLHPEELRVRGLDEGQRVDLTSHFAGQSRRLRGFRVLAYDLPRGCAAAYFPEANGLVPLGAHDPRSRTPAYKSIPITLEPSDATSPASS